MTSTLWLLLGIPILFVCFVFFQTRSLQKIKTGILKENNDFFRKLQEFDEELRPYLIFDKGKVGEKIQELRGTSNQLLNEKFNLEETLLDFSFSFSKAKEAKEVFQTYQDKILSMENQLAVLFETFESVQNINKELEDVISSKKEEVMILSEKLNGAILRTKYPLNDFKKSIDRMHSLLDFSNISSGIDPIEFKDQLELELKKIPELEKDLEMIEKVATEFEQIDEKIAFVSEKVEEILKEDNITSVQEKKAVALNLIDDMKYRLQYYLEHGKTNDSVATLKKIFTTLEELLESSKGISQIKNDNDVNIQHIEDELSLFTEQLDDIFTEEIQKLKERFTESHWIDLSQSFKKLKEEKQVLTMILPKIKELNDVSVQEYEKAKEGVDSAINILKDMKHIKDDCFTCFERLTNQFQKSVTLFAEAKDRYEAIMVLIEKHNLSNNVSSDKKMANAEKEIAQIDELFAQEKHDVTKISSSIIDLNRSVHELSTQINEIVRHKKDAEKSYLDLKTSFSKKYNQYHRKMNVKNFAKEYQIFMLKTQECFESGLYSKAIVELENIKRVIEDMTKAFEEQHGDEQGSKEPSVVAFVEEMERENEIEEVVVLPNAEELVKE